VPAIPDDVAIVGIGCRFPGGANSPEQFWRLLHDGVDAISEIPSDRFELGNLFDADPTAPGKLYVRWGGYVDNITEFDAQFFGISPREAAHIDPQHRMLLEVTYEALEDAGIHLEHIRGSATGVFVGISTHDYGDIQMHPANRAQIASHSNSGTATSIAANRISYLLDLRGPSLAVDTACSSSLTAVHLACRSIADGECGVALVGGVQLLLTPEPTIGFCKATMLSPDGRCHAFDAAANGYVRAEGAGIVVLKPLAKALADGDSIYAVIKATAINQDGHTNGMTVPSLAAQSAMIRNALARAGLSPDDIDYVEAHGTGTPVGDPIEAGAIGGVLGQDRPNGPCLIGSVKTNIGHLEAAAGMAGLIKAALSVAHREIPPSLHHSTPNPAIDFARLGLRVVTCLQPWPQTGRPATAGVNSFGFGGANAHVLLQEAPPRASAEKRSAPESVERAELLPLSARSGDALAATARAYLDFLSAPPACPVADVCGAAALRRTHHEHRAAIVATTHEEMIDALDAIAAGEQRANVATGRSAAGPPPKLAFVFAGMGAQWWGMGRQLMREEPVYRDFVERCDALLHRLAGWSLVDLLAADEATSRVADADVAQVTNFVVQAGLAELWRSWGVVPDAVIGHSGGSIAASHVAGVHDLPNTLMLAYHRSRLQGRAAGQGTMLAVGLHADEAERAIGRHAARVALAAVNSPSGCALAGDAEALEAIMRELQERSVFARLLQVTVPYHSAKMDPIREELLEALRPIEAHTASIRIVSDLTGTWADGAGYDAAYWWETVRQPVRFAEGIATLIADGVRAFLEISPHPVLATSVRECLAAAGVQGSVLPSLRRLDDDRKVLLRSLGGLYAQGRPVRWEAVQSRCSGYVKLPSYPWQRDRHWFEPAAGGREQPLRVAGQSSGHPLLGARLRGPNPVWEAVLGSDVRRWLADHVVHGAPVFPGAGYVELALAVATARSADRTPVLRDVEFSRALFAKSDAPILFQASLDAEGRLAIHSSSTGEPDSWTLHARSRIDSAERRSAPPTDLGEIGQRCAEDSTGAAYYEALAGRGLAYGPTFRGIKRLQKGDNEAFGRLDMSDIGLAPEGYSVHPALLDAAFQVLIAAASRREDTAEERRQLFLPVQVDAITVFRAPGTTAWSHARLIRRDRASLVGDIDVLDDTGELLIAVRGLRCKPLEHDSAAAGHGDGWLYDFRWHPATAAPWASVAAGVGRSRVDAQAARSSADLQAEADRLSVESGWRDYYETVEPKLDELAGQLAVDALRGLGWHPVVGERGTVPLLLESLGIAAASIPMARRLLAIAREQGLLSIDGANWRVEADFPASDPEELSRILVAAHPAYRTDLELMLRCGRALPGILRGAADAREVLFADGAEALTRFYREAPASSYYSRLLVAAVTKAAAASRAGAPLRILEIGGGTGGVTSHLLAALAADRIDYTFTDVSPLFTAQAAKEFGSRPTFAGRVLDIEQDPVAQGFAAHSADIVIAANVLHATADLSRSLAHVRRLLAPGGLLVLLEITRRPRWLDVIFGITEGWWKFNDHGLRPDHPLLDPGQWSALLAAEGFDEVFALADAHHPGAAGQTIFLAHAPAALETPEPVADAEWLILSDRAGTGARLAEALARSGGGRSLVLPPSDEPDQRAQPGEGASAARASGIAHLLDELGEAAARLRGVVVLGALDAPPPEGLTADALLDAQRSVCGAALTALAALRASRVRPLLCLVTAGAQAAELGGELSLAQAPLWGLGRVMMREQTEIRCRLIDLDRALTHEAITGFARELVGAPVDAGEEEVALHGANRWVRRLARLDPGAIALRDTLRVPDAEEGWRIEIGTPGAFSTLVPRAAPRRSPAPGEVEIAIAAAGLNFRDVMLASGMIPSVAAEQTFGEQGLGLDCAGRVVRCGDGVEGFAPGDEVLGIAPSALGSFTTTRAALVARKPSALSFEEASAIPCAFVTAHYALEHLARVQPGERVLIHAATGGVGLAAIQIARMAGADVFASAGSPEKRDYLRSIGVEAVMDSRSLSFADTVLEMTGGEGVDVVLNSLAGEAIAKGIGVLRPYGRFIEIGKRDIYGDSKIGLLGFRKNISFFAVDLDRLCNERPALAGEMLREVTRRFDAGIYQVLPQHVFPVSEVETAVRFMAQAKHIGKIVLNTADPALRIGASATIFRADGTYLITGGLGGFGLATARWMIGQGARSLVLAGRRGAGGTASAEVEALSATGSRIEVVRADVSRREEVAGLIRHIRRGPAPLRGIVHAAMVLDDAPLGEMTETNLRNVLAPKMAGAWNLHAETSDEQLDFFVLYSSIATILGNPMQANYSAANAFLDALAHHRRALGRPALAVNWGVVSDAGYVAQRPEIAEYLHRQGYGSFASNRALEELGLLLRHDVTQAVAAIIDWRRLANYSPSTVASPTFRALGPAAESGSPGTAGGGSFRADLLAAADANARLALIDQFLREKIAKVLGIPAKKIDSEKALTEMGLDSLIAVELVTILKIELGFELPVVKLLQGLGIRALAELIAATLPPAGAADKLGVAARAEEPPVPLEAATVVTEIVASIGERSIVPVAAPGANGHDATAQADPHAPYPSIPGDRAGRRDYAQFDYERWSGPQRAVRWCARGLVAAATRVDIEGEDRIPSSGPFIIAVNHLSLADVPLVLTLMERPVVLMAAEWLRASAPTRWLLGELGNAIFVQRGEGDVAALEDALTVLRFGGVLGISPEGRRSTAGRLVRGQTGVAYLATRANVPVLPIALWGQEHVARSWRRLHRPDVHIRVGDPIRLPAGNASGPELQEHTDRIMRALAALLPSEYRGVYD
jgi:1-acyl-sn-glycerol-3-phosphate acyltransferase